MAFPNLFPGRPIAREEPVVVTVKADTPRADLHEGASKSELFAALPRRRAGVDIGALYLLPSGMVVTPLKQSSKTSWDARVIIGIDRYPVGGYDLCISVDELEVAREIRLELAPEAA